MLDHEERVPAIAQIVHDAHQPANIAWMQTDARLVHDKERVNKGRAETGSEINALHFAAAQSAGGTVEREITDADLAQIIQSRANFIAQHPCSRIARRDLDLRQQIARVGNGKSCELRKSKQIFAHNDFVIERFRLKPPAIATRTSGIGAVTAEQHPHVHFVNL